MSDWIVELCSHQRGCEQLVVVAVAIEKEMLIVCDFDFLD